MAPPKNKKNKMSFFIALQNSFEDIYVENEWSRALPAAVHEESY